MPSNLAETSNVSRSHDPIAIIGMSCRFSGSATDPESLWDMLMRGQTGWSSHAGKRFNLDAWWHPTGGPNGTFSTRGLHLLTQDPASFDAEFFSIAGTEATAMDPQHRLLLEVAYEAFENAGVIREKLAGSNTAVYAGISNADYEAMLGRDPAISPSYRFTGTGPSLAANRISHAFDLRGPSMAIDTACSSSLVAIHAACRALQAGDAEQALVGGTNLILDPEKLAVISSMNFLSPDGRCYAFDNRASGYGRGEGVAAVLLKPLSTALAAGDSIRAVIRGSAVLSDGRTLGITNPSADAQLATIQKAYEDAGLDPQDTYYIEAHGTGTQAGDKAEILAFSRSFCAGHKRSTDLVVGSNKTALGHTESTAGLAGLIKAVLVLENGVIPGISDAVQKREDLDLDSSRITIATGLTPWPDGVPRRASVNATGYGGTNAHIVMEKLTESEVLTALPDSKSYLLSRNKSEAQQPRLFVLSHQRTDMLRKSAHQLKRWLKQVPRKLDQAFLDDLAFTLAEKRTAFDHRAAFVAANTSELNRGIDQLVQAVTRPTRATNSPKICFAFTGQGAQWAGMGRELLHHYPIFAESIRASETLLNELGATWKLRDELENLGVESSLHQAWLAQPCTTALQIALVELLRSWSLVPASVCGHSSGEIAACYAAGILTQRDALKVAFQRGEVVRKLRDAYPDLRGSMLAVALSREDSLLYIDEGLKGRVGIACVNSPSSVTLSGDKSAISEIKVKLEAKGVFNRALAVDVAYHSHHMRLVRDLYTSSLEDICPRKISDGMKMVSSVKGRELLGSEAGGDYWAENLVSTVLFSDALGKTLNDFSSNEASIEASDYFLVVEIGPHAALKGPISQTIQANGKTGTAGYFSSLLRQGNAAVNLMQLAGNMHNHGAHVNFDTINSPLVRPHAQLLTALPPYQWSHDKPYWAESRRSLGQRLRSVSRHELLGTLADDSISTEPTWKNFLRLSDLPWLKGHRIHDQNIFPGAAFLMMAIEALRQHLSSQKLGWRNRHIKFRDVFFTRPLLVDEDSEGVEVVFTLKPSRHSARAVSTVWNEFQVHSLAKNGEVTEHCNGLIAAENSTLPLRKGCTDQRTPSSNSKAWAEIQPQRLYRELKAMGADYTGAAAQLQDISAIPYKSRCRFQIPDVEATMPGQYQQPHTVHALTLEACFQSAFAALKQSGELRAAQLLAEISELSISSEILSSPGCELEVDAQTQKFGITKNAASLSVSNIGSTSKAHVIEAKGVLFASSSTSRSEQASAAAGRESLCHRLEWRIDPISSPAGVVQRYCNEMVPQIERVTRAIPDPCEKFESPTQEFKAESSESQQHSLEQYRSHNRKDSALFSDESDFQFGKVDRMSEPSRPVREDHTGDVRCDGESSEHQLEEKLSQRRCIANEAVDRYHAQLAEFVRLHRFKNPSLQVLEIGGASGVPNEQLVDALSDGIKGANSCRYVFAETSFNLDSHRREKIAGSDSFVETLHLDIEKGLEEQGLEAGSFDLVVVSDAMASRSRLLESLAVLRNLLKPSGQVAIIEITDSCLDLKIRRTRIRDRSLETIETQDKGKPAPLFDTAEWEKALTDSGFSGVESECQDQEPDSNQTARLLFSHAVSSDGSSNIPGAAIHIIVDAQTCELGRLLARRLLRKKGIQSVCTSELTERNFRGGIYIFLLEAERDFLSSPDDNCWRELKSMIGSAEAVLWVTRGGVMGCENPSKALVTGLSRSLRAESPSVEFVTLDLDPGVKSASLSAGAIDALYDQVFGLDAPSSEGKDREFAWRQGAFHVPRLVAEREVDDDVRDSVSDYHPQKSEMIGRQRALGLRINSPGILDTIYWADVERHSRQLKRDEVRIEMEHLAINFRDVMTAVGDLSGHSDMLIEGAGRITHVGDSSDTRLQPGTLVYAFDAKGLATTSNVKSERVIPVPDCMAPEVAAAVPVVYATALYALQHTARIRRGESVLIHSAAGSVGQAAIAVAQYLNISEIFVTVGTTEKSLFLQHKFGIPADHIFSSRDLDFGEHILEKTQGRGVDVVLNSLAGEAIRVGCSILAPFGRFVEIGKKDLLENGRLEMRSLAKNATFAVVDLVLLAEHRPQEFQELVTSVFDLIATSQVQLIDPIAVRSLDETEFAFREMQSGKHKGKLVLRVGLNGAFNVQPPRPQLAELCPRSTYLVVGGTGEIGRVIVRLLARLGAKSIVTLSRSGMDSRGAPRLVEELHNRGVNLVVSKGDVSNHNLVQRLKDHFRERPIRGVIQSVAALQDTPFESMTSDQWRNGTRAKVTGAQNLMSVFSGDVDFMILLSSVAAIIGTYGQSNYCAGNVFQDAIARSARAFNTPVCSIDVGLIRGVGVASEEKVFDFLVKQGLRPHTTSELEAVINYAIQKPCGETPSSTQIVCGARQTTRATETLGTQRSRMDAKFSHMWVNVEATTSKAQEGEFDVHLALQVASTANAARDAVYKALRGRLAKLLGVSESDIQADRSVASYGLDSLMAVELKNWVDRRLSSFVQSVEVMSSMGIRQLAWLVAERSAFVSGELFKAK